MRARPGGSLALVALLGLSGAGRAAEPGLESGFIGQAPILTIDSGGHMSRITRLVFTHDGHGLVSVGDDKIIRVWSVDSGETVRTLRGQIRPGLQGEIYAAALSPDDRYLAVGGYFSLFGSEIRLYNFQTGEVVAVLNGHLNVINALAFSPDGRMLASASFDKTVHLWDVSSRQSLLVLRHDDAVYTVAFSPDGTRVVSGSWDWTVRLWDAKSGALIRKMEGHKDKVRSTAFSADGRYIASGSDDKSVRLWDAATGAFVKELSRSDAGVYGLSFTPDSQRLLVENVPRRNTYKVISVPEGRALASFEKHDNRAIAVAVSPDGKVAATGGGSDRVIYLWDLATGSVIRKLAGSGRHVWSVGFASDGRSIAFGTTSHGEGMNLLEPLEQTLVIDPELGISLSGKVADPGTYLRAVDRFGVYQLKTKTGKFEAVLQILRDGEVIREITRDGTDGYSHRCITWTPDGKQFVSGGENGFLTLYDGVTGQAVRNFVGHMGDVSAVAVSPDGKRLVSGSADQTVRLWDLTTGANLLTVFAATDGEWVAWTPQGFYASSLHGDRYIGWHVNQGADRAAVYYPAAQFQKQFYRPDVVAEYLKDGDIQLALTRANAHRGPGAEPATAVASIEAILPPLVYVAAPRPDGMVVETETLPVLAAALSNNLPITDLRVTVNGTPVSGLPEGRAKGEPLQREVEVEVTLRPGDNVLTFQAAHAKARSQPVTRHVTYRPPAGTHTATPAKPNLILLAVGISDYSDPLLHLSWAAEDARQVYDSFKRQEGKLFDHVEARLLPDGKGRVGRQEIFEALNWFAGHGDKGDVRVLFLSGHGTLDRYRNFYFLSQDQPVDGDPELEGIPWNRFLDSLTSGAVLPILMIDTCHAAAVKGPPRASADLTVVIKTLNGQYPGIVTFAASSGVEPSVERDEWRHGAFTAALLEGLAGKADGIVGGKKDEQVDTLELSTWLIRRVAELTGDQQHANFESGGEPPFPLFQVEP